MNCRELDKRGIVTFLPKFCHLHISPQFKCREPKQKKVMLLFFREGGSHQLCLREYISDCLLRINKRNVIQTLIVGYLSDFLWINIVEVITENEKV